MSKGTRTELVQIREETYRITEKRCESCRHSNISSDLCFRILVNGRADVKFMMPIDIAGVCDLWEARP